MTPTIIFNDELVDRCRKREERAQLEVYNNYYKAMYNTALRIVNDTAEAEDIMQEAFLKAFSKIDSFKGQSTFGAWLKRIVINMSLNVHSKNSRYRKVPFEDEFKNECTEDSGITTKEEFTDYKVNRIVTAMKRLKNNYRVILSLHFIEGYDYDEICEILNISPVNCRTTISRAKDKLRAELNQDETYRYE